MSAARHDGEPHAELDAPRDAERHGLGEDTRHTVGIVRHGLVEPDHLALHHCADGRSSLAVGLASVGARQWPAVLVDELLAIRSARRAERGTGLLARDFHRAAEWDGNTTGATGKTDMSVS